MPRTRSSTTDIPKRQLAENIHLLLQLLADGRLHEGVVRQVVKGACWWVSNAQGKRDDCQLWSKAALELREQAGDWPALRLVHEHLVPRNLIEDEVLNLVDPSVEDVEALLSLSEVCITTDKEDAALREAGLRQRMPAGSSLQDRLARYRAVGIEVVESPRDLKH